MKRHRAGYTESNEERAEKVQTFIRGLHFSLPLHRLREQHDRRECPKCHKRRLYYCYDCLTVVHPESHPPALTLPLNVYVILHPNELRGKSTSLAASTISPNLHIVEYPLVPESLEPESTLVLYPSEQSVELHEVEHLDQYRNVVFIDSTWQQSKCIARDERVTKFTHVRIKSQTSLFWRFQNNDPTYLATVEAIYYFLREYITQINKVKARAGHPDNCCLKELTNPSSSSTANEKQTSLAAAHATTSNGDAAHNAKHGGEGSFYHGEVDDLLYYYINQYIGVQQRYTADDTTKYTDRHFSGYIIQNTTWDDVVTPPPVDSHGRGSPTEPSMKKS